MWKKEGVWEPENVARGSGACTATGVPTGTLSQAGGTLPAGYTRCARDPEKMLRWEKPEPWCSLPPTFLICLHPRSLAQSDATWHFKLHASLS